MLNCSLTPPSGRSHKTLPLLSWKTIESKIKKYKLVVFVLLLNREETTGVLTPCRLTGTNEIMAAKQNDSRFLNYGKQMKWVGFEVLTAVSTKMAVLWVVAPCSLVEVYQRFRGPCCLHHQGPDNPEDSHLQMKWDPFKSKRTKDWEAVRTESRDPFQITGNVVTVYVLQGLPQHTTDCTVTAGPELPTRQFRI
jgi:hypothetical protein